MAQHPPGGFLANGNAQSARNLWGARGWVGTPDVTCRQVAWPVVRPRNTTRVKECAGEHLGERAGDLVSGHMNSWPGRQAGEQSVGRARERAGGRESERAGMRAGGQAGE